MVTASSDPELEPPVSAGTGEEVVVSEKAAAFLVRQRAADVVEVIEMPSDRGAKGSRSSP
jgi:hypothetical protein